MANRGEVYFELKRYPEALADYQKALELKPDYKFALAGLAVTHHALGNKNEAKRYWQDLLKREPRYSDMDWLQKELNWADALVAEARKLVAEKSG